MSRLRTQVVFAVAVGLFGAQASAQQAAQVREKSRAAEYAGDVQVREKSRAAEDGGDAQVREKSSAAEDAGQAQVSEKSRATEDAGQAQVPEKSPATAQAGQDENRVETTTTFERPKTPERSHSIDGEELDARGVTTVEEAILELTGAQRQPGTGTASKISIDGLPSGYITVLRDGVPIGRPVGGPNGPGVDLAGLAIDPSTIERIEVKRGLGPGGTSGVVIDIITNDGATGGTVTSRTAGAAQGYFRQDLTAAARGQTGAWSTLLEAGILDRAPVDVDGDEAPDAAGQTTAFGRGTVGWRSGLDGVTFRTSVHDNTTNSVGGPFAPFDDRVTTSEVSGSVDGTWQGPWGKLEHTSWGRYTQHDFDKVVRDSGFVRPKASTTAWGLGQTASSTWYLGSHDLKLSGDLRGEWVERQGETGAFDDAFVGEAGLSLGDRWYAHERLELLAEVRGVAATPYGEEVEAELGGSLDLGRGFGVRASVSRTRRLPTTEELYLFFDHSEVGYQVTGNPELQPELLHSANLELGWQSDWLTLSATGFGHLVRDGIVTETAGSEGAAGPATFTYVNAGTLYLAGLTSQASVRLPLGLRARLAHTYQPLAEDIDGNPVPLRPEQSLRAELIGEWLAGRLTARTWLDARGSMPVPDGSPPADSEAIVNIGVGSRPAEWARVGLDLRNVFDTTHPTWGPFPGRYGMVTLGVRL